MSRFDAESVAEEVRAGGYALLPGLHGPEDLSRLGDALDRVHAEHGSPPLTAPDARWLAPGVEVAPPGLALYGLLGFAPELAPWLFRDEALSVLRKLLGEDMHLELVGAVMSDETRPFTEWESHLGGIDDERWRREGKRPRRDRIVRMVHFLFLDALEEPGTWQVVPRAVGDPVEPLGRIADPDWPGAHRIVAEPGTVLLLEESVWHSVRPLRAPGRRRFVGSYFATRGAEPTLGRDESLDRLPEPYRTPPLDRLLRNRPAPERS